jgi:hypothetical protein
MSKTHSPLFDRFDWAAVCDCGWAASSTGTSFGRHRIEQLGINHDRECDDDVTLERRSDGDAKTIRPLSARCQDE